MQLSPQRRCVAAWLALAAICVLLLAAVGTVVYNKHRWLQDRLGEIEPRYARLMGLQDNKAALDEALVRAQTALQRHTHSSELDATQLGNEVLAKIKQVLAAARFDAISTQVLVEGEIVGREKINIVVKGEGDINALMGVLSGIYEQTPTIVLDSLSVQSTGFAAQYAPQRMGVQFNLFLIRGKK